MNPSKYDIDRLYHKAENFRTPLETYIYNSTIFHEILSSSSWDLPWTSSWSAERKEKENNNNNNKKRSKNNKSNYLMLQNIHTEWNYVNNLFWDILKRRKRQNTFKKKDLNKSEHKKIENLTETHDILLNFLPETS